MVISDCVQGYRAARKLSIRTLAKRIGVHHNALWRFEKGEEISQKQWVKIFMWLVSEDADPIPPKPQQQQLNHERK